MLVFSVLAALVVANAVASSPCPNGWTFFAGDNTCLKAFGKNNFKAALSTCRGVEGGDLVHIRDDDKNHFVLGVHNSDSHIWIGVWDKSHNQKFTYTNGAALNYRPWNGGEPNNYGGREACGMLYGHGSGKGKWNDAQCAHSYPFVCQRPIVKPSPCPAGWYPYGGDKTCLKVYAKRNFKDALAICRATKGGELVQIHDKAKDSFTLGLVGTDTWIGVWDKHHKQSWTTTTGKSLAYKPWNAGEPNNYGGTEACGMIYGHGSARGSWNDLACSASLSFVCQQPYKRTEVPRKYCPEGWKLFEGDSTCLKVFDKKPFQSALQKCRSNSGGDLVIIKSKAKNDFATSLITIRNHFWIGVWDKHHRQSFKHTNGDNLVYKPWNGGEPNNYGGKEACGMIIGYSGARGKWNDANCAHSYPYICEQPATAEPSKPTTTKAPKPTTTEAPKPTTTEAPEPTTTEAPEPTEPPKTNCPEGWKLFKGDSTCMKAFEPEKFSVALALCRLLYGTDLVIIKSKAKNDFVKGMIHNPNHFWIGVAGNKHHTNGEALVYTPWASGEPNSQDCVLMIGFSGTKGKWKGVNCNVFCPYICQQPAT